MPRRLLLALAVLAFLAGACGGGDGEAPPTGAPTRVPVTPGGGLAGTLVWRQSPYLHTGDLPADAVARDALESLGEAEVGPERLPQEVFRPAQGSPWELLSEGVEGWLVWEPLAVVEARRHLAGGLDLAPDEVEVRDVEEEEWPDSCLGLPREGEVCAQVITPGFRVLLRAGGDDHEYRSDRSGRVRAAP